MSDIGDGFCGAGPGAGAGACAAATARASIETRVSINMAVSTRILLRPGDFHSNRANLVLRLPLLLLFFASGCAALIYELVWFHLVQLVVGASSISMAVLLASFMGGMALGSALLPRLVSRARHPLRVLAGIEAGLAAIGLLMPWAIPLVQHGYVALAGYGYASVLLRAAVCALLLLPPTMLMGATLPAISRWTGDSREGTGLIGLLYMANIAGGAVGTVLAGFYLLRVYDTVVAGAVAVTFNLAGAAGASWLARVTLGTFRSRRIPDSRLPTPGSRGCPGLPVPGSRFPSTSSPPSRASPRLAPRSCGPASSRCSSAPASTPSR